ncbi:DUF3710 domain-containing protein [Williamsia sp. R60]
MARDKGIGRGRRARGAASEPDVEPKVIGSGEGPYDIGDLAADAGFENSHLDLGSVLVPVVEGGQVTVEMTADHQPQAVYLVTPHGRITVAAFAAPKSSGQWREVVGELTESLRAEGAETSIETGFWGREVVATVPGGIHRFIGVDGPRWMIRCVASAPTAGAESLSKVARAVVSETVVRRGDEPHPPRTPLAIVLPPVLAEQVAAAQQQMAAGQQNVPGAVPDTGAQAQSAQANVMVQGGAEAVAAESEPPAPAEPEVEPGPVSRGSAMQQLRNQPKR